MVEPTEAAQRTCTLYAPGTREPQPLFKTCELQESATATGWLWASQIMLDLFTSCVVESACDKACKS